MRNVLIIIILVAISSCKVQQPLDNDSMATLTIKGMEDIRRDYMVRWKFHKAHEIKKCIKQIKPR